MKIKQIEASYPSVQQLESEKRYLPKRPSLFFRILLRLASAKDLKAVNFTYQMIGMDKLKKKEPCLILMNHSSFLDLKMTSKIFFHRPLNIVMTSDGVVGKKWLMRQLGCIPTHKFITDHQLIKDMNYAIKKLKTSILLFPEATYSLDGRSADLPISVGRAAKELGVPIIMITTHGSFLRDPLYNELQLRKVNASAEVEYLLSPEELKEKSEVEIFNIIRDKFKLDYFKEQKDQHIVVNESFRADGLHRILYKCPHCGHEGMMEGKGTTLTCHHCHSVYELTELGELKCLSGEGKFSSVAEWYDYQREEVKKELLNGTYSLDVPVDIGVIKDSKALYRVGKGRLCHNKEGFLLTGARDTLSYRHSPLASYSLYADYFWYEINDVIAIGNEKERYYCFPLEKAINVLKAKLATEELYKLIKERRFE